MGAELPGYRVIDQLGTGAGSKIVAAVDNIADSETERVWPVVTGHWFKPPGKPHLLCDASESDFGFGDHLLVADQDHLRVRPSTAAYGSRTSSKNAASGKAALRQAPRIR